MQNEPAGEFAGTVAAEIRAEMGRQRLEVGALAEHLGVSRRTASRLVNGHQPIDLTELQAIGEFLETDPLDLIRRTRGPQGDAA
jgi:DNA-binding Xre family transcriptional regulator